MHTVMFQGLDELAEALDGIHDTFNASASRIIQSSLDVASKKWSFYPPQPSRTRAKTFNTYVRGIGHVPKSEIIRTSGNVKKMNLAGVKHTSEQMNTKFSTEVKVESDGITGILSNDASYAGWVIGTLSPSEGEMHQVPWHTATGWTSADEAVEVILKEMEGNMSSFLDNLAGG